MSRDAVRQHYGTAPLWDRAQAALTEAGLNGDAVLDAQGRAGVIALVVRAAG